MIWYKNEAAFIRFRELCEDKENFGDSYVFWLKQAEEKRDALSKAGTVLIKVYADPAEFAAWCKVNACPMNQRARYVFAAHKGFQKQGHG